MNLKDELSSQIRSLRPPTINQDMQDALESENLALRTESS